MDIWEIETIGFVDVLDVGDEGNLDGGYVFSLSKWLNSIISY